MKKPDPEMIDRENPEWTDAMFANAKPASEVFPDLAADSEKRKRGQRGPQRKPRKVLIALRLGGLSRGELVLRVAQLLRRLL